MAKHFTWNGVSLNFCDTFETAKTITAITNASPAVATVTGHGFAKGDIVFVTCKWRGCDEQLFRVGEVQDDTFELEGLDATDTAKFPRAAGTGTVQRVSAWQPMPDWYEPSTEGGEPEFINLRPVGSDRAKQIPNGRSAESLKFTIDHRPGDETYERLVKISRNTALAALQLTIPASGDIYGYGYITVTELPKLSENDVLKTSVSVSFPNPTTTYAAQ